MRSLLSSCAAVFVCALVIRGHALSAEEPQQPVSKPDAVKAWNAFYQRDAQETYRFELVETGVGDAPARERSLEFDPTPILRWTNPLEEGDIHGAVYVWRDGGRPVVLGQLFSYLNGRGGRVYCHAMHSLARRGESVTGLRDGKVFWKPDSPGVEMHEVPMAPPPAANRAGRLSQMKAISRRFTAYTEEATRGKRILRLLPTPLDRIPEGAEEDADGALFSLVVGNDPEVILLVETATTPPTGAVWRYGLIRSTRSTSVVLLDEKEVWRHDASDKPPTDLRSGYLSVHGIATLPLEPPVAPSH